MFKFCYLADFFQNQTLCHFGFEQNLVKNDQILIEVTLRLKIDICLIMTTDLLLHMRYQASVGYYYIKFVTPFCFNNSC